MGRLRTLADFRGRWDGTSGLSVGSEGGRFLRALLASFLLLSLTVPSLASAQEEPPTVDLPPELERVLRDYETNWEASDAAGLAALFTEDGFVLQNGRPPAKSRAAIEAAYAGAGGALALRAYHYHVDGTAGFIIGGFAYSHDVPAAGKFVLALELGDDGRWLIAADMDNMNRRPGG